MAIAFDRFVEAKRGNAIDFCQVAIQDYPGGADSADHSVDLLDCNGDVVFFTTAEKDYLKIPPMTSPRKSNYSEMLREQAGLVGSRQMNWDAEVSQKDELRRSFQGRSMKEELRIVFAN
jgi:hypothetical protein